MIMLGSRSRLGMTEAYPHGKILNTIPHSIFMLGHGMRDEILLHLLSVYMTLVSFAKLHQHQRQGQSRVEILAKYFASVWLQIFLFWQVQDGVNKTRNPQCTKSKMALDLIIAFLLRPCHTMQILLQFAMQFLLLRDVN